MNVVIIIPIYKEQLSVSEKVSLKRCIKVLGGYQIFFVTHHQLSKQEYIEIIEKEDSVLNCDFIYFDYKYFKSIQGYNELMLSRGFYNAFSKYNFILLYQLDAFVFQNELDEWCRKGFDYIGAPWFHKFGNSESLEFRGVGNGGFSLRKPKAMLSIINRWRSLYSMRRLLSALKYGEHNKVGLIIKFILEVCYIRRNSFSLFPFYNSNEDYVWGLTFGKDLKVLSIPTPEEALRFAFEDKPEYLFKLNNGKLPLGCHGWEKYNVEFWRQYIIKEIENK